MLGTTGCGRRKSAPDGPSASSLVFGRQRAMASLGGEPLGGPQPPPTTPEGLGGQSLATGAAAGSRGRPRQRVPARRRPASARDEFGIVDGDEVVAGSASARTIACGAGRGEPVTPSLRAGRSSTNPGGRAGREWALGRARQPVTRQPSARSRRNLSVPDAPGPRVVDHRAPRGCSAGSGPARIRAAGRQAAPEDGTVPAPLSSSRPWAWAWAAASSWAASLRMPVTTSSVPVRRRAGRPSPSTGRGCRRLADIGVGVGHGGDG